MKILNQSPITLLKYLCIVKLMSFLKKKKKEKKRKRKSRDVW